MTAENQPFLLWLFGTGGILLIFKVLILALVILYAVFALVVVRQVDLMTTTLETEGGPILRVLANIHAGVALGIIVLFILLLFG